MLESTPPMDPSHTNPNDTEATPSAAPDAAPDAASNAAAGPAPGPAPGPEPGPAPDAGADASHTRAPDPAHPAGPARNPMHNPLHDPDATPPERTYAMWIHIAALIAWVLAVPSSGLSFWVPIVVAAIMWTVRKQDSPFIDDHGREALNFQISLVVMAILVVLLGFPTCGVAWFVGVPALVILGIVGTIMGAVAASKGEYFRYPATFRFLKG